MSAEWWRSYRARNRQRLNTQQNERRRRNGRVRPDRSAEYARRSAREHVSAEPLPMLMPHLQHGTSVSFWEDELRLDLAQEAELAKLEGCCPKEAVRAYRAREMAWRRVATYELIDALADGDMSAP